MCRSDTHGMVLRHALFALESIRVAAYVTSLQTALMDEESSVRIAAAVALSKVNGAESARRILAALLSDNGFQMRWACVEALAAMKELSLPLVLQGVASARPAVREVCIRGLAAEAY